MMLSDSELAELVTRAQMAAERGYALALAEAYIEALAAETGDSSAPDGVEENSAAHVAALAADALAVRSGAKEPKKAKGKKKKEEEPEAPKAPKAEPKVEAPEPPKAEEAPTEPEAPKVEAPKAEEPKAEDKPAKPAKGKHDKKDV